MRRAGALLAAGGSTRFGLGDKLLAPWRGRPLVTWAADALRAAGCDGLLAVVSSPAVAAVLPADFSVNALPPGAAMSASFKHAVRWAQQGGADGLLLCLGDMPNVSPALLRRLLDLPGSGACAQGHRRLPPVHIAAGDFARVLAAPEGDHGARALVAALPGDRLIPVSRRAAHDIDRPADLEAISAR